MNRRSFLVASGSAVLSGAGLSEIRRPAFALEFELLTVPSTKPSNVESVLVDFDNFSLIPRYVDGSREATVNTGVSIGEYSTSFSKQVSVNNGEAITNSDIKPEVPMELGVGDTTGSSIEGEIYIEVDHPSIDSESYNQNFTITDNPLVNGIIAYYPIEKGAGPLLYDGSGNNHNGELNGASWDSKSTFGDHSLYFDGSDSLSLNGSGMMSSSTEAFTSSAWIYIDDSISNRTNFFLIRESSGGGVMSFKMDVENDSSLRFQDDNNGYTKGSVPEKEWVHIAVVADQNGVRGYINGQELQLKSSAWTQGTPDTSTAGVSDEGQSKYIEELRMYKRSLSETEIQSLYNITKPTGNLIDEKDVPSNNNGGLARYKFDDNGSGDTIPDSWGDNDGIDNTSSGYSDGVYSKSKIFDGSDDYVDLSDLGLSASNGFSFSAWYKAATETPTTGDQVILGRYDGSDDILFLSVTQEEKVRVRAGHDGGNDITVDGGSLNSTDWNHVGFIYRPGSTLEAYLNGRLVNSNSGTVDDFDTSTGLDIGRRSDDSNYVDGYIDDVRIYSQDLDSEDMKLLYRKGSYRV